MFLVYESNLTVSSLAVGELGLLKIVLKLLPMLILLFLGNFIIIFFCSKKPLYCCYILSLLVHAQ